MQKKITLFVISAHVLLIFILFFSPPKKTTKPMKHISVRTVQSKSVARASTAAASPKKAAAAPKAQAAPKTNPKAPPKKEAAKKEVPKKAIKEATAAKTAPIKSKLVAQKKPVVTEKKKPKPDVWKKIDEALAKIDDKVYSEPRSKLDVPRVKGSAPSTLPFPDFGDEGMNEETLVSFLHTSLNLPELGEVKIQLTVKKDGSVGRLVVLEAQSKKNRAYLEKHLPLLKFPLAFDKERTFTLTFCNEI
jgi:outer membrane biosynthesis protein TonB